MNYKIVLHLICLLLRIEAAAMVPALIISAVSGEYHVVWAFTCVIIGCALLSLIGLAFNSNKRDMGSREGFACVSLGWIIVSIIGALPFYFSGAIPSLLDCIFESVSGFTTTGATTLPGSDILPSGLLYWRSFTHWLGGMGVLVFLLAVTPLTKTKNTLLHLMRAESPGPQVGKLVPRIRQTAKILYIIYVALTAIQFLFLLVGGMPVFDSLTTAFATAATGGVSIKNASLSTYSTYSQIICSIFMIFFGINFSLFYMAILKQVSKALRNQEFKIYLSTIAVSTILVAVNVFSHFGGNIWQTIHHSAFQVISAVTTTGFTTVDYNAWPSFSKSVLLILMMVGACAGSTGGGLKISRVLIMLKAFRRSMKKLVNPRSVSQVIVDGSVVNEEVIQNIYAYMAAYAIVLISSTLVISLDTFSFETNLTAVLACLNNIGSGLDVVSPTGSFAPFSPLSKIVLCFNMLVGRLEIFPMLLIFTPLAWKK